MFRFGGKKEPEGRLQEKTAGVDGASQTMATPDPSACIRAVFFATEFEEHPYATHGGTLFVTSFGGMLFGITARHVFFPLRRSWSHKRSGLKRGLGSRKFGASGIHLLRVETLSTRTLLTYVWSSLRLTLPMISFITQYFLSITTTQAQPDLGKT